MTKSPEFLERLPLLKTDQWMAHGLAIALALGAWLVRWALDAVFPPGYPFVVFFPVVILTAFLFGPKPGLTCGLLCGLLAWYYFIPPYHAFGTPPGTWVALTFYAGVVCVDIALVHWMQSANRRLRAEREERARIAEERGQLAERNSLLFRELQHRVANNLQMIGSVLSLQMQGVTDATARKALAEASNRLSIIGSIQRELYDPQGGLVSIDKFLAELTGQLIDAEARPGISHHVVAEADLLLAPDAAIPVALIMAEAVANAIEHAFEGKESGHVAVTVSRHDGQVEISVADDGHGLPTDFDINRTGSLGLKISRALAHQLRATYAIERGNPGSIMRLLVPERHLQPG